MWLMEWLLKAAMFLAIFAVVAACTPPGAQMVAAFLRNLFS